MATIVGTVRDARKALLIFRQYPEGITGLRFVPSVESMRQWPIITEKPIIGWIKPKLDPQNVREDKNRGCCIPWHPFKSNIITQEVIMEDQEIIAKSLAKDIS